MADFQVTTRGFAELRTAFQNAPRKVQDIKRQWQKDVALAAATEIRDLAPGRIKQAIQPTARDLLAGVKLDPEFPARYVDEGTGIYGKNKRRIYPTSKSALAFVWKGKERVFASVKGQKAQHFIRRGINAFNPKVNFWMKELNRRLIAAMQTRK